MKIKFLIATIFITFLVIAAGEKIFHSGFISKNPSGVGTSLSSIDSSAVFEVDSSTQGFLPPRMTTTERDNIGTPADGLMIWNETSTSMQVYNTGWEDISLQTLTTNGDVLYYNSGLQRLAKGSDDQVLTLASGIPSWADAAVGADGESVGSVNYLKDYNPGFETGDGTSWTNAGSGSFSVQNTTVGEGSWSGQWDAAAASDTLTMDSATLPSLLKQNNSVFCFKYTGGDTNINFQVNDGSGDIVDETLVATASGIWETLCVNVVMPNVSSVTISLESSADAAVIYVDSFFMGDARMVNISQISQTQLYAGFTSDACNWATTSSSWTQATTACADEVFIGKAQNSSDNYMGFELDELPPGNYLAIVTSGSVGQPGAVGQCNFRFNSPDLDYFGGMSTTREANSTAMSQIIGYFTVTASISSTKLYVETDSDGSVNCQLEGRAGVDRGPIQFLLFRYPLESQTAYTPSVRDKFASVKIIGDAAHAPVVTAGSWTTLTDSDIISGDRTNSGQAENPSTVGDVALKISNLAPGNYMVIASGPFNSQDTANDGTNTNCDWSIYDGTNRAGKSRSIAPDSDGITFYDTIGAVVGHFNYTSVQSSITWSIQAIKASGNNCIIPISSSDRGVEISVVPVTQSIPMPQILNNVVSSSSDGVRIVSARITNSGTPTIDRQDGTWISSITDSGVGDITLNLAAVFSTTPNCSANSSAANLVVNIFASSSSAVDVNTFIGNTAVQTDTSFTIICVGAK